MSTAPLRHVTTEAAPFAMVPEALLYDPAMSDKATRLYGVLARHGTDPSDCYPSKRRLADLMGCAPSSIGRPLRELEEAGWISRVARVDHLGAPTSNGYHVHLASTSSATPAQENAHPPRAGAGEVRAGERAKGKPVNESHGTRRARDAQAPLELVAEEGAEPGLSFEEFWRAYPRGDGKPAAVKAWANAVKVATPETVMEGLAAWLAYWRARDEPEFVPWAQKWLKQQQWFAKPPALRRPGKPAPLVTDRSRPSGVVNL